MDATIASIVAAADLPLSILIVGVGNADFSMMETLDGDEVRLSYNGKPASRDIVQFVPIMEHAIPNSSGRLVIHQQTMAKALLEEIPDQLLLYMKLHGIVPNPHAHLGMGSAGMVGLVCAFCVERVPLGGFLLVYGCHRHLPQGWNHVLRRELRWHHRPASITADSRPCRCTCIVGNRLLLRFLLYWNICCAQSACTSFVKSYSCYPRSMFLYILYSFLVVPPMVNIRQSKLILNENNSNRTDGTLSSHKVPPSRWLPTVTAV
jgi:hypothetical protein